MSLLQLLSKPADHVVDELLAEHPILEAREQSVLQLPALDSEVVLADTVTTLCLERAAVLRPRRFRLPPTKVMLPPHSLQVKSPENK